MVVISLSVLSLGSSDGDVAVGRSRADRRPLDVRTGAGGAVQLAADLAVVGPQVEVCRGAGRNSDGDRAVGPGDRGRAADLLADGDLAVRRPSGDVGGRPGDGDVAGRGGEVGGAGCLADPDPAVGAADLGRSAHPAGRDGAALAVDVEAAGVVDPDVAVGGLDGARVDRADDLNLDVAGVEPPRRPGGDDDVYVQRAGTAEGAAGCSGHPELQRVVGEVHPGALGG